MILTDAYIFQGDRGFIRGSIEIKGNVIGDIIPDSQETDGSVSLHGDLVLPGLVDIHTHGSVGHCFSDGSYEGLVSIGKYMASHGVTTFLPTSMTLPHEELKKAFETAVLYKENRPKDGAKAGGIHMEGPYLSEGRKGSQNGSYLRPPDPYEFQELSNGCGGMIRIVDVAPELEGAAEFIRKASSVCKVSVAHTEADHENAMLAFGSGASHVTHLFNGMSAAHHRQPGVV
nr:amidohydrolase family protein [Lachnospiraceae bacterium]